MSARPAIDWYFDYISPFAYLQSHRLDEVAEYADIRFRPVLFAGLLRHWEHKGPVEIPGKKLMTYRYAHWLAQQMGIPYKTPDCHPFNPLAALRLTLALDCRPDAIRAIFRTIWGEGLRPDTDAGWQAIIKRLDAEDAEDMLGDPAVKAALMENGQAAIEAKVFGVPTFVANGELFWGVDTTDMLIAYLKEPGMFQASEWARLEGIEPSAKRRS